MEINTNYQQKNPLVTQGSLPEQRKIATPAQDKQADKTTQIPGDTVTLSIGSLKLSQPEADQGNFKVGQIENADQARKVADQVVSGVRNNPGQAQQAYGNLIQVKFKALLG